MDESPSIVGARAEREVAYALERSGWAVYLPVFASHGRIDLIVARGPDILRVQCKTSRLRNGVVLFRTCSNTGNKPKSYRGEIDVFGVYSPELDRVFLVPIDDACERLCSLRLTPAANNQARGVRFARDYELTPRC
jgi:hypothetical protein